MSRETLAQSESQTTNETAYFLSNYQNDDKQHTVKGFASVSRGHWHVESNNWRPAITFGEDGAQVRNGNQAQIMGKLRCFSMNLPRCAKKGLKNLQANV